MARKTAPSWRACEEGAAKGRDARIAAGTTAAGPLGGGPTPTFFLRRAPHACAVLAPSKNDRDRPGASQPLHPPTHNAPLEHGFHHFQAARVIVHDQDAQAGGEGRRAVGVPGAGDARAARPATRRRAAAAGPAALPQGRRRGRGAGGRRVAGGRGRGRHEERVGEAASLSLFFPSSLAAVFFFLLFGARLSFSHTLSSLLSPRHAHTVLSAHAPTRPQQPSPPTLSPPTPHTPEPTAQCVLLECSIFCFHFFDEAWSTSEGVVLFFVKGKKKGASFRSGARQAHAHTHTSGLCVHVRSEKKERHTRSAHAGKTGGGKREKKNRQRGLNEK
jgi:hypothetical protein